MKYKCLNESCKRTFEHAAHIVREESDTCPSLQTRTPTVTVDRYCCPYCLSLNIEEIKLEEAEIVSVKSVDIGDADQWMSQGYRVHELYAKTVTLVKRKTPEQEQTTTQEAKT